MPDGLKPLFHSTQAIYVLSLQGPTVCTLLSFIQRKFGAKCRNQMWSQQSKATTLTTVRSLAVASDFCQMRRWSLLQENLTLYEAMIPYDMEVWS
jgi:hypothetical protein